MFEKLRKNLFNLVFVFAFCLILSGCATLSYVGEDYAENNIQTFKTNEDFIFNVYKKTDKEANIKIGISKTPINEIFALVVQVENLSYEIPYVFKVEDLDIFNDEKNIQFITSNNYLSIYQTQEASSMSSMSSLAPTLTNMTGMISNYNDFNQAMVQNASNESNRSAFNRIETIGNQILAHSIKVSSSVSPRKSQYFYFFFEDPLTYPINVQYKNLLYKFNP